MFSLAGLEGELKKAQAGDKKAREDLLEMLRPFVFRVAAGICHRQLEWGRDDELSIGLIAANEAIDRYDEERLVPFLAFARLLIKSRLTDYLRRQARLAAGEEQSAAAAGDVLRAREEFWEREAALEREEEIREFDNLLNSFGISLRDLVRCSPRHSDTRAALLRAARVLAGEEALMDRFLRTKKLPVHELAALAGVGPKVLERGRKYVIAVALIWYNCQEFLYLCSYLKPAEGGGEK
jgi:RNA polymerase sigma factor